MVCRSRCNLCRLSPDSRGRQPDPLAFTQPATAALEHGVWKTIEGRFKSIMAVVIPCRSDQSTLGLSPYGHLADGRLHLILVKDCSIMDYLRFLISIPQTGQHTGEGAMGCGQVVRARLGQCQASTCLKRLFDVLSLLRCAAWRLPICGCD